MFQCKDLLTLPSMAKARIIAGKSGLSNRIRWVYKPENMNFAKWVKGQELLIISTPVIQSKDFDLQAVIKKAKKLDMAGALLLVGDIIINTGLKISIVYLVVGIADFVYNKHKFNEDMKMTKQEVKDEFKNTEGDPQIKGRQKR